MMYILCYILYALPNKNELLMKLSITCRHINLGLDLSSILDIVFLLKKKSNEPSEFDVTPS